MTRFASKTLLLANLLFLFCAVARTQTPASTTVYLYDELGRLKAVLTPSGDAAIYNYDGAGNIVSITRQLSTTVSILEFTPDKGPAGSSVTIYGTGFSLTPSQNRVLINGVAATVSASSATQLIVTIPFGATAGPITVNTSHRTARISVTTAGGTAVSRGDFFVTPSPFTAASVDFTARIARGETKALSVNATDRVALILFDGTAGQRVALQSTRNTISSSTVRVIKPDGTNLFNPTSLSGNWFVDTLTLPVTGTYTIVIDPDSTFTGTMNLTLHNVPANVTGALTAGCPAITVNTTTPGQNASLIFTGTAGQRISLDLTDVTLTNSALTVRKPDGTTLFWNEHQHGWKILRRPRLTGNRNLLDPDRRCER